MNTELFSIFDAAANRYMDPFCGPTIEFGIRGFKEACGQEGHQFGKFPEDYHLFHVGTFDGELGLIVAITPHKIANANSFVSTGGPQLEVDRVAEEGRA